MTKKSSMTTRALTSGTAISDMEFYYPKDLKEQNKIGKVLTNIDDTITLHQRKLEKLKSIKTAYLKELFPAEGQRKPLRRFPGFTDDWEQRKLGDNTKLITKGTTPKNKVDKGQVNFVKIENLFNSSIKNTQKISGIEHFNFLKRSILKENDILFSIAGSIGRTALVHKSILPANTNQALAIIRGYQFDRKYLITYLSGPIISKYVSRIPTVGAQPNLSLQQVSDFIINSPKIHEQQKIGKFFDYVEKTITLHQRKIEKLQKTKEAMLNELFV